MRIRNFGFRANRKRATTLPLCFQLLGAAPQTDMDKVWDGICAAQLILADCTQENANVFYEIGLAHAVGKKVVLITRSEKDIPSDLNHFDYISYFFDPEGTEQLIEKLRTFIKSRFKL